MLFDVPVVPIRSGDLPANDDVGHAHRKAGNRKQHIVRFAKLAIRIAQDRKGRPDRLRKLALCFQLIDANADERGPGESQLGVRLLEIMRLLNAPRRERFREKVDNGAKRARLCLREHEMGAIARDRVDFGGRFADA